MWCSMGKISVTQAFLAATTMGFSGAALAQGTPCNTSSPFGALGCAGQMIQQVIPQRPAQPQVAPTPQAIAQPQAPAASPAQTQPAPQAASQPAVSTPKPQQVKAPPAPSAYTQSDVDALIKKYVDDDERTFGELRTGLIRQGWKQTKTYDAAPPSYKYCAFDYARGFQILGITIDCISDGKDPTNSGQQIAAISLKTTPAAATPAKPASMPNNLIGVWQGQLGKSTCVEVHRGLADIETINITSGGVTIGMPPENCKPISQSTTINGTFQATLSCSHEDEKPTQLALQFSNGKIKIDTMTYVRNACPN